MSSGRFWSIILLIAAGVFIAPAAANGAGEDPLGLLIGYDVSTYYSLGEDHWEVWICEAPDGKLDLSASEIAGLLESELVPYFDWLSGGRYRPVFRAGTPGKVDAPGFGPCLEEIAGMSRAGTEGVIGLVNQEADFAQGDPGPWWWTVTGDQGRIEPEGTSYPDNGRNVIGGSGLVTVPPDQTEGTTPPRISILAHEIGHTLRFPHSYFFDPGGYENPMDIMSDAEAAPGLQVGTIALNRYAAGWIDQEDVEIYSGNGRYRYTLSPPGMAGTQMLVLKSGENGFITLGARVRKGYDSGLPKEGVESYFTDTEVNAPDLQCGFSDLPCFGLLRPTQAVITNPTVPLDNSDFSGHVMEAGDGYNYGDISVQVIERSGDRFIVEVADEPLEMTTVAPSANAEPLEGFYEEAYDADPLGLIAGYDSATAYTLDEDLWEVWICRAPDGYLDITPEESVSILESNIAPYFERLSGGRYRPVFRVGGSVDISFGSDPYVYDPDYGNCESEVAKIVRNNDAVPAPEGIVHIVDKWREVHYGTIGDSDRTQSSRLALHGKTAPNNNRKVGLGGTTVATPSDIDEDALPPDGLPYIIDDQFQYLSVIAHEIGHALGFPHSRQFTEYDNPMDVMSRVEDRTKLQVGTISINRYAAGWIKPSEVAVFGGRGTHRYRLSPPGDEGTQMLVIKSEGNGYLTLGTRVRKNIDMLIPKEGVEVYFVDEQSPECEHFWSCVWRQRPTRAVTADTSIPLDFSDRLAHVMDEGDGFATWNNTSVTVVERIGDDFVVEVTGSGRFTDDDGNVHEDNIEAIAAAGITVGCGDPEDNLYCPSRTVTRAQMAAFLIRALGETAEGGSRAGRFSDVPQDAWYLGYVERLADLNIVRPGAAFRPSDPLTRLEMAVWMSRAFDSVREVTPQGVFDDVPADAQYAAAVEGIRAAGITRGCSTGPPAYCPDDPVRRDQMASFLGRALAAQPS